jgi:hypothetical protein
VKLAITLLVAAVMPFGLVVLAGVVANRMLARYHRQRRSPHQRPRQFTRLAALIITGERWVTMLRQSQSGS